MDGNCLLSFCFLFFCIGTTLVFLIFLKIFLFISGRSNITSQDIVSDSPQVLIILTDILSYPQHVLESNNNNIISDNISLFVTRKEFILVLVLHKRGGDTLLLFIGVDIQNKNVIKKI